MSFRPPLPLLAVVLVACATSSQNGWSPLEPGALTPAQTAQRDKGLDAKDAVFGSLMTTLQAALKEGGPANAIPVCRDVAPSLAKEVSEAHNVQIGRTAFRKRNPDNTAPAWAAPLVEARAEKPAFLSHPDGRLAMLLPIHLQQGCVQCHGTTEQIAPEVRTQLAEHYPADKATGFKEGNLRGWFWIEVPGE